MAFQPVPDTAEVIIHWINGTINMVTTFYGHLSGGYGQGDITALAAAMDAYVDSDWLAEVPALVTYVGVTARGLEAINDFQAFNSTNAGVGAVSGDMLAPHSTFAIKRLSGLTGRSARGRVYWPGIATSQASGTRNEQVISTNADNMVAIVDGMRSVFLGLSWTPVIVSRVTGGAIRPTGVNFAWLSTGYTDLYIDTLRRRTGA